MNSVLLLGPLRSKKSIDILRKFSKKLDDPTRLVDLSQYNPEKIRNFSIVAHVDHGKSTLADRLLELTGVVRPGERDQQILDRLRIEKERGITVKAQTVSLPYKGYLLNLIDTPGHADFSAEVSRSLTVCDGILLLIAANQGVQAQTIANFWLAFERNIRIIPVINKIDLTGANIPKVEAHLANLFEFEASNCLKISAKSGLNVEKVLDEIIEQIPPPTTRRDTPFKPDMTPCNTLHAGQVGYVVCNMKTVKEAVVGETLFDPSIIDQIVPFPGFKPVKPTLFAGLFPMESSEYDDLKQAVERLSLNDPSVEIIPDSSLALGLGWRVGFLGVLHMEVFGARLDQEYGTSVILTSPSVEYRAIVKNVEGIRKRRFEGKGEIKILDPSKFPDESDIEKFLEPMVKVRIIAPSEHMGIVNGLCTECRGERGDISSIDEDSMMIIWRLPLAEVVVDFFERLKRLTSGYASFDYEHDGFKETRLIKLALNINGKEISEFSQILPVEMAKERAKLLVSRLKREIPRQQFEVEIKACVGNSKKALSQVTLLPMKRDFSQLMKGNIIGKGGKERLNKKLSHQKKGKERLKQIGNVLIPKEAFLNVLKN